MSRTQETEAICEQITEIFNTGIEAVDYLISNGLEGNEQMLEDLKALCEALAESIGSVSDTITLKNWLKEIGMNAPDSLARILQALRSGDTEQADMEFTCEFVPLFLYWERYAGFFLIHGKDDETLAEWHKAEREYYLELGKQPKTDEEREYKYDLSVVVLFYGHKEMTEQCLDAINKYTQSRSYELITLDNGSDEETAAWCAGLPHKKKVRYTYNMGSSGGGNLLFSMTHLYCEGKYLVFVSNDVIVTPRYDEILFNCLESDPEIALAVPICNSASNLQAINVPYAKNDMAAMQEFAENYNRSDPKKRTERARLMTILAAYRFQPLKDMYLAFDPFFCYDMYADDDHSRNLRRMGWKQVLCGDVFVHHYGSATIGENQFKVMELGRKQYYQKHGVDAWNPMGFEFYSIKDQLSFPALSEYNALVIDPLFGESALAMKSRIENCGSSKVVMDALTEDARFLDDMMLFDSAALLDDEEAALGGKTYNFILIGTPLEHCKDLKKVLDITAKRLARGGMLLTYHRNMFNLQTVSEALSGAESLNEWYEHDKTEAPAGAFVTRKALETAVTDAGLKITTVVPLTNPAWQASAEQTVRSAAGKRNTAAANMLATEGYYTLLEKA